MAHKAPGKSFREGISLVQIFRMFPDDATAEAWFVARRWPTGGRVPALRLAERPDGRKARDDAVPVPREAVRQAVQPEDGDRHGGVEARAASLDDCDVPRVDQPQERSKIGIRPLVSEPEVDAFCSFGIIRLGSWHFTTVLEFRVIKSIQGVECTAWDLQFRKLLMSSASTVEFERAKGTVKAAFDQYVESSKLRIMYIGDGDVMQFGNLGNAEKILRTNR